MNHKLILGTCALLAAESVMANPFDDVPNVMDTLSNFDAVDFLHSIPMSKDESPLRKSLETQKRHEQFTQRHTNEAHEAVHRVSARRETLGLPKIAGGYNSREDEYSQMQGSIGRILGIFYGLQYSESGPNFCFSAIEGSLVGLDTLMFSLSRMYIPAFWPLIQTGTTDLTALTAHVMEDCDVDKFLTTMSGLASAEGASELGTRASASYFFEYRTYKKTKASRTASSFQKGKAFGELFKKVADYSI